MEEELKAWDLQIHNFIECYGFIEIVKGIIPETDGTWRIIHSGWHAEEMPEDILFRCYGIVLDDNWNKVLGIVDNQLPSEIQYVHEAQNYIRLMFKRDPVIDYELLQTLIL